MGQLQTACTAVATVVAGVSGIRQSHDLAPDNPNAWPTAIVYPQNGNFAAAPIGYKKALHNITIDVLVPEQTTQLARQMETLTGLVDLIGAALLSEVSGSGARFSGSIDVFEQVEYSFLITNLAGVPCRGYRFTLRNVKILGTL